MWCFQRLGLDNQATKSEVKKAYHRLALETHPDKVMGGASQKEAATEAFRQVYDAFEAAMEYCESGTFESTRTEDHCNEKRTKNEDPSSYTNDFIRQVFQDISDELAREQKERIRKEEDELRLLLR